MMAWNGSSHAQNVMLLRNDVESGGANGGDTTSLVAMLSSGLRGLDQRQEQHSGGPKRPFYAMFDGLDDTGDGEVADDSGGHVEKKRRLTAEQVRSLEMSFEVENRLEPVRKMQLAQELGLQPRQVAVWFQNRRARWKTKQLERDYDILKAAYESLAEENKKLKAQLERLVKADEGKEEDESEDVKEEEVEEPAAAAAAGAAVLEDVLNNPKRTEIEQAASGGDDVCTPDSPTVVSSKFKESPISDGYNSEVMDAFSPHAAAAAAVTKPAVPPQGVENCHEQAAAAAAAPVKEEPCGVDSFPQMNYRLEDPAGLLLEEPSYNCFFAVPEEEQGSWPWWDWS